MNYSLLAQKIWNSCLFHERRCTACHSPFVPHSATTRTANIHSSDALFCSSCLCRLTATGKGRCIRCAMPLVGNASRLCGECLFSSSPWDGFVAVGSYEGVLRELILRGKRLGDRAALDALGQLLAETWLQHDAADKTEYIVPLPAHPKRLLERGFNQCLELARPMGAYLGLPIQHQWLFRKRESGLTQQGLSPSARHSTVQNAFVASPNVFGRRLLLVDDVLTTGATLRHAVCCLKKQGATHVDVAVVGRATFSFNALS